MSIPVSLAINIVVIKWILLDNQPPLSFLFKMRMVSSTKLHRECTFSFIVYC